MSDQHENCQKETIVHQLVKVRADVNIQPHVKHGRPKVFFVDTDIKQDHDCDEWKKDYNTQKECVKDKCKCAFTVTQLLCIEIPIAFDVDVDVDQGTVECCKPDLGPCKHPCNELGN